MHTLRNYENKTIIYGGTFHRSDQDTFPVVVKDIQKNSEYIIQSESYPITSIQVSGCDDIYYTTAKKKNNIPIYKQFVDALSTVDVTGEDSYFAVGIGINDKLIQRVDIPAERLLGAANNYIICAENKRAINKVTTMEIYSSYEEFMIDETVDVLVTGKKDLEKQITGLCYPKSFRTNGEDQHVYYTSTDGNVGKIIKLSGKDEETQFIHDRLRTMNYSLLRDECIFEYEGLLYTPVVTHDSVCCASYNGDNEVPYSVICLHKYDDGYKVTSSITTTKPIYALAAYNKNILYTTGNEKECLLNSLDPYTGEVKTLLREEGIINCVQAVYGTIEMYRQIDPYK